MIKKINRIFYLYIILNFYIIRHKILKKLIIIKLKIRIILKEIKNRNYTKRSKINYSKIRIRNTVNSL